MLKGCLLTVVGFFTLLAIVGSLMPEPKRQTRSEEVREGCQREFPGDHDKQVQCFTVIMVRDIEQRERDALERAAR